MMEIIVDVVWRLINYFIRIIVFFIIWGLSYFLEYLNIANQGMNFLMLASAYIWGPPIILKIFEKGIEQEEYNETVTGILIICIFYIIVAGFGSKLFNIDFLKILQIVIFTESIFETILNNMNDDD